MGISNLSSLSFLLSNYGLNNQTGVNQENQFNTGSIFNLIAPNQNNTENSSSNNSNVLLNLLLLLIPLLKGNNNTEKTNAPLVQATAKDNTVQKTSSGYTTTPDADGYYIHPNTGNLMKIIPFEALPGRNSKGEYVGTTVSKPSDVTAAQYPNAEKTYYEDGSIKSIKISVNDPDAIKKSLAFSSNEVYRVEYFAQNGSETDVVYFDKDGNKTWSV